MFAVEPLKNNSDSWKTFSRKQTDISEYISGTTLSRAGKATGKYKHLS